MVDISKLAKFKVIAADAAKLGKEGAVKKYGSAEVKAAQDSLRRQAEAVRKRAAKEEDTQAPKVIRTPTSTREAQTGPRSPFMGDKSSTEGLLRDYANKIEEEAGIGSRGDADYADVAPAGISTLKKSDRIMSRKNARKFVEKNTGETQGQFESRVSKEARQGGVGAADMAAEAPKPQYELTTDQANAALRGKVSKLTEEGSDSVDNVEPDLVDILKGMGYKKGGRLSKSSTVKPRGVGIALRGWGKAMRSGR